MSNFDWAQQLEDGRVIVDPAKAYPFYFALLGEPECTQYWLEVARMCFTEDLARLYGHPLHVVILKNDRFALKRWPVGAGAELGAASWKPHYDKLVAKRRVEAN